MTSQGFSAAVVALGMSTLVLAQAKGVGPNDPGARIVGRGLSQPVLLFERSADGPSARYLEDVVLALSASTRTAIGLEIIADAVVTPDVVRGRPIADELKLSGMTLASAL